MSRFVDYIAEDAANFLISELSQEQKAKVYCKTLFQNT